MGQTASFKVQFFCLSYTELINYPALALSVPDFHPTDPCLHSETCVFYAVLPQANGHYVPVEKEELYALPKLGNSLRQ